MFKKTVSFVRQNYTRSCAKLSVGAGLLTAAGASFAADGTIDTSSILTAVAGGLAAALVVSVAMSAAVISVRASKLPRRGA